MKRSSARFLAIASVLLLLLSAVTLVAPRSAAAVDAGTVTVRLHSCPSGFDGVNASLSQLAQSCQTPIGGVDFAVQYNGLAPAHQTDLDGSWQFTDVSAGQVILTEVPPDPSFLIRAGCSQFTAASGPGGQTEEPAGQGSVTFNLLAGQAIDCDWYNFPATQAPTSGGGLINTRTHNCPASYAGLQASIYDLAQSCQAPGSGYQIKFSHDNTQIGNTATTDSKGWVQVNNFQPGEIEIDQLAPPGITVRAFCEIYDDSGNSTTGFKEYPDQIVQLLNAGDNFQCDIFMITTAPVGTGTVYLNKHNCPAGFDAASANIYSLAQHCNGGGRTGIGFALTDANPAGTAARKTTDANGLITWTNILGGPITIAETFPAGYSSARAFCNNKKLTGDETGESEVSVDPSGKMAGKFIGGYDFYYCDWFDIPTGSVTTSASPVAGQASPVVIVVNPNTGATPISGGPAPTQVTGGNQPTGQSNSTNSNSGNSTSNSNGNATEPATSSGPGSITIDKFTCPKGYNGFAQSANPVNDCASPTSAVQFSLKPNGGASVKQTTGGDGRVSFTNLDAGSYQLTETLPAGVTSAFLWSCVSNVRNFADYPFLPFARIGTSGLIGITLQTGENLECSWYDVPSKSSSGTAPSSGGTVVKITLLACPGQSVTVSACKPAGSGVKFIFTPSGGGSAATLTTDNNGIASGQIAPGTYALSEGSGSWCLADSAAFNQSAKLVIGNAPVAVSIYNCGG